MSNDIKRPEWVPENAGSGFTTEVLDGVKSVHDGFATTKMRAPKRKGRPTLTTDELYNGILAGDRSILARAITLVESNAKRHFMQAQDLIQKLLPHASKSLRIGISGVPGAGKSTFIEAIGVMLCEMGYKVAVLAVDPSSSITKGSILGDKTRMEQLSNQKNAFIRPSPSGGMLGGVARKSRETILLCEAAGYDVILVETVGVGQNEITVRSMVDFFLLVLITGAGDELQGMKKGVMEICDAIMVNKADGDNLLRAKTARADFDNMLHYLRPATKGWKSRAYICSALKKTGIKEIWDVILEFEKNTKESGVFKERRNEQKIEWVNTMVIEQLKDKFYNHPMIKENYPRYEQKINNEEVSPTKAATELLAMFDSCYQR